MKEFGAHKKQRRGRQMIMAVAFLAILGAGWRYPLLGFFIPFCMFAGIGIGLFRGRQWCDWLCPRGSFYDAMLTYISPSKEIPRVFKGLPMRIGVMAFLMAMMAVQIVRRWPDPYSIGMFFVLMLTATTTLGVVLALFIHPRTWCCICPIGTMTNWIGRSRSPLHLDSKECTGCSLCGKVCPIQVEPHKFRKDGIEAVKDGDCLKCGLCIAACPKQALSRDKGKFAK